MTDVFITEGANRTLAKNMRIAGYLATVAGFVNVSGFVLIGSFTSHVTGNVGRLAYDLGSGDGAAASSALVMVLMFVVGAFVASLMIDGATPTQMPRAYGYALITEAALLLGFVLVAGGESTSRSLIDVRASLLSMALGMQNSLVTRLSGAVIRTTHLTGVFTDLAIEGARWCHWLAARTATKKRTRPERDRAILLATIVCGFFTGSLAGAGATLHVGRFAMIAPALAVGAASVVAFVQHDHLRRRQ